MALRKDASGVESFALPPLLFVEEHGPQLGEPFGWILERGEDDRAFVDREREQRDAVVDGNLEPVRERIAAGRPDRVGEVRYRAG